MNGTVKIFKVISDFDGIDLQGLLYEPNAKKRGLVLILHGMCEHKGRYESFMKFLCTYGYVAVCYDQRGHGDSVKTKEDRGYFYDRTGEGIVKDVSSVVQYLKTQYPDLPIALFGHSMGSLIARCYLQNYDDTIDKALICGTPKKNKYAGVGIFVARCISMLKGDRYRSKTLTYVSVGKGDKRFKKEGKSAWLCRNPKLRECYRADEKGQFLFTANGFENLFRLLRQTYKKKAYALKNPDLPIFFLSGEHDPVMDMQEDWADAVNIMPKIGYQNVSGKLYAGMRHDLINDYGYPEVRDDILAFLEDKTEKIK